MNRTVPRRILLGTLGMMAVAASVASLAWACAPPGTSLVLSPTSGPTGMKVTATVSGFEANEVVKIRWDTVTGPELGRGTVVLLS